MQSDNIKQTNNQEEVDLIRLFNYFKSGIKSFFRGIGRIIESFIYFIILIKTYWILVVSLILLGGIYGFYVNFNQVKPKNYQMIVKADPNSNLELYAFSSEINSGNTGVASQSKKLAGELGLVGMKVEPIEKTESVIDNYFETIEATSLRGDQTDTLYFKAFEINDHKKKMEKFDYSLQKLTFYINSDISPDSFQSKFLDYLNNLPNLKREQANKLAILKNYEYELKRNISNIDSLLASKAIANKQSNSTTSEQVLVNTASRGNVEADLLRYSEVYIRKLYGTQKMINNYQNSFNVISDARIVNETSIWDNNIVKYSIFGFLAGCIVVLLIRFNKYLGEFEKKKAI